MNVIPWIACSNKTKNNTHMRSMTHWWQRATQFRGKQHRDWIWHTSLKRKCWQTWLTLESCQQQQHCQQQHEWQHCEWQQQQCLPSSLVIFIFFTIVYLYYWLAYEWTLNITLTLLQQASPANATKKWNKGMPYVCFFLSLFYIQYTNFTLFLHN